MTPFDFAQLSPLVHVLEGIAILLLWLRKPGESAEKRADKLEGRMDVVEERITHMPTSTELMDLRGTVREVGAKLDALEGNVEATRSTVTRIEQFLLTNK